MNKEKIICPEPSPDALAVAASSFGISVGIPGKGGGSAGGGTSEAAMSLFARSQAIQAVRDTVTATCLAYQNGIMPKLGYHMMIAAYPDILLSSMAIEGVTGTPLHQPGGVAAGVPSVNAKAEGEKTSVEVKGSDPKFQAGLTSPTRSLFSNAESVNAVGNMAHKALNLSHIFTAACMMRFAEKEKNQGKDYEIDSYCTDALKNAFGALNNAAALAKATKANKAAIKKGLADAAKELNKAKASIAAGSDDTKILIDKVLIDARKKALEELIKKLGLK